jgi:hypothetical protein
MKRSKTAHANIACVLFLISTGAAADTFIYNGLKLRPLGAKETGIRNIIVTGSGTRPKKSACSTMQITQVSDGIRLLTNLLEEGWVLNQYSTYSVCSDATTGKLSQMIAIEVQHDSNDQVSYWKIETPSPYPPWIDFDFIYTNNQEFEYEREKLGKTKEAKN